MALLIPTEIVIVFVFKDTLERKMLPVVSFPGKLVGFQKGFWKIVNTVKTKAHLWSSLALVWVHHVSEAYTLTVCQRTYHLGM